MFGGMLKSIEKGGLLITAYIPRYFVFQYIATSNEKYLDEHLAKQIIETGVLNMMMRSVFGRTRITLQKKKCN